MGLNGEDYVFNGPAPSHEQVWQTLCDVLGREVERRVFIPHPEFATPPDADWRPAEERGCYLTAPKCTTFIDGKRSIEMVTFLRGDMIFAQSDHAKSPLAAALREAMARLGGRIDRGECLDIRRATAAFTNWTRPWTFETEVSSALGTDSRRYFEMVWQKALDPAHWKGADLAEGTRLCVHRLTEEFPHLTQRTVESIARAAAYHWQ